MAWYRAGGGGIPAALKTGMNDVLNKKFGTSTTYAPNTWPDNVNLLGKLPEKTVSGSIAHIDDGADRVPVKSWGVNLPASLTGYSSADVVQAGKNLWRWGDVTANRYKEVNISIPRGTYTISVETLTSDASPSYCQLVWTTTAGTQYSPLDYSTKKATITLNADATRLTFYSAEDYSSSGGHIATFVNIQLEVGSTATTFEAYNSIVDATVNLGRTIYGGSVDVVQGTGTENYGKVVFDGTEGTGGTPSWTMISVTQGTMFRITVSGKATTSATNTLCSYYTPTAQAQRADGTVSGAGTNVDIIDNRFSSVDAFKAWLAENPVTLVYELATSTDFTFTPITPKPETALGVNNFWADANSTSEVTYRRDIDLALGGG